MKVIPPKWYEKSTFEGWSLWNVGVSAPTFEPCYYPKWFAVPFYWFMEKWKNKWFRQFYWTTIAWSKKGDS